MGKQQILQQSSNDVVVCSAVRTPITRARKGALSDTCIEDLLVAVFTGAVERAAGPSSKQALDKKLVQEIQVGNVLARGGAATVSRMAQLAAGFPSECTIATTNRQCSSGLTAVNNIALQIAQGQIECGIGAGVESMSLDYGAGAMAEKMSDRVMENQESADCLLPMGITSENVAAKYNVSRQKQDAFAAESFSRAAKAHKAGLFKGEIVPVKTTKVVGDDEKELTVTDDDGIRDGVTAESLGKLKPVFSKTGSTHAGNASQVSDGAAAVLLASRSFAKKHGLQILGRFVNATVVGVPPNIMGIGPALAIPKLLATNGLGKDDVDFYEINEAFASQAVMSVEHIGLDFAVVNPRGGAIALGHPLGATGARQVATGYPIAKERNAKLFVTSMCIGSGMGMAALFTNEQ